MSKLTQEEAVAKATTLSKELGKKVQAICLEISDDDLCVGFVKEASRQAKIVAWGSLRPDGANVIDMGLPILESGFIAEHSDARMNPFSGDDDIVLSAAMVCASSLKAYSNTIKKK